MKRVLAGLLVVMLLAVSSSQAFAFWGKEKRSKFNDPQKRFELIAEKLELTEDQKKVFRAEGEKTREEMKAQGEKMKDFSEKMKAELKKDPPNRKVLHRLITKTDAMRTKMHIRRLDSMLDLREILTPEQKEEFGKMLEKHKRPGFDSHRRRR
jgi:periplasmic protein CpxP/Spy